MSIAAPIMRQVIELTEEIVKAEFVLFGQVNNEGGRASCQDNWPTFHTMRAAQFHAWDVDSLKSYRRDLETAVDEGRNPLFEKYAYMMEYTSPEEYEKLRSYLPACSPEKEALIEEILEIQMKQTKEFAKEYPTFFRGARPIDAAGDQPYFTSIETYTRGECKTYSETTLRLYLNWIHIQEKSGNKIVFQIYKNTAYAYGFRNLQEADANQR